MRKHWAFHTVAMSCCRDSDYQGAGWTKGSFWGGYVQLPIGFPAENKVFPDRSPSPSTIMEKKMETPGPLKGYIGSYRRYIGL